jgi:hypothetical protein
MSDFFNIIGCSLPIIVTKLADQTRCKQWSERMQMTGQVECKRMLSGVQFHNIKSTSLKRLSRMTFGRRSDWRGECLCEIHKAVCRAEGANAI